MREMLLVGMTTLTLVGCDGDERPARTAAALPAPKAGLWRETLTRDGHPMSLIGEMRACLDADARARLTAWGGRAGQGLCQDRAVTRDGDGAYHFSSTCQTGPGGRVTTQGLVTGDFASRYRVHTQSDTTGASVGAMNGRHVMEVEADYLGPCPADMTAGDVIIANGMKVNMDRLRAAAQALSGGG
jgi:hypothetical protein